MNESCIHPEHDNNVAIATKASCSLMKKNSMFRFPCVKSSLSGLQARETDKVLSMTYGTYLVKRTPSDTAKFTTIRGTIIIVALPSEGK